VKQPGSSFSEDIRTARTAIRLATMGADESNVIMVTSALPDEGKSTIALNLALAQSQVTRTLMVECDIRRPTLGRRLDLPESTLGLTECLSDGVAPEACTVRVRDSNLHCIVA